MTSFGATGDCQLCDALTLTQVGFHAQPRFLARQCDEYADML
jgi:hypothetical protein